MTVNRDKTEQERREEKRARVLKGLECHAHISHECEKCPYDQQRRRWLRGEGGSCDCFLADDALALVDEMDTTIRALLGEFGDSCGVDGCGGDTNG